jgi:hypothetical protein
MLEKWITFVVVWCMSSLNEDMRSCENNWSVRVVEKINELRYVYDSGWC